MFFSLFYLVEKCIKEGERHLVVSKVLQKLEKKNGGDVLKYIPLLNQTFEKHKISVYIIIL